MSKLNLQRPRRHSAQSPDPYPPSSYEVTIAWNLSMHSYLLIAIILLNLTSLCLLFSKFFSCKSRHSPQEQLFARHRDPSSHWVPKLPLTWYAPTQVILAEGSHTPQPSSRLRLDINFNRMGTGPLLAETGIQDLRFGILGEEAPVQELDAARVIIPDQQDAHPPASIVRLRGGSLPHHNRDTETQTEPVMGNDSNTPLTRADARTQLMNAYLALETLFEKTTEAFVTLERHQQHSLLRHVLLENQRQRLIVSGSILKARLNHVMELLGVESDEAVENGQGTDEMERAAAGTEE